MSIAVFVICFIHGAQADNSPISQHVNACLTCHGNAEYSRERFGFAAPKLGGQSGQYIVNALAAYKDGSRSDKGVHSDNADKMIAAELTAVAGFFSELEADDFSPAATDYATGAPGVAYDKNKEAYDRKKVVCASCHSRTGEHPTQSDWPILAGQYGDYIVHALREYKGGQRQHAIMTLQAEILDLTEEDIQKMAHHYSVSRSLTAGALK